ncbi:SusC/RagA family TonB-linked outer membrane protein [Sunxiuqinia sp. sy24]|uniref:SusC/RagA family TonB-linked outer membrane protein n=1 Tax=Sunxiuqinia sp. sy24 TaxID=3461495 RepID=UPI0040459CC2
MKKKCYSLIFMGSLLWKSKLIRTMRTTLFLMVLSVMQLYAVGSYSQSTRMSLNLRNVPIKQVLKEIEDQSEFYFIYDATVVDVEKVVSVNAKNRLVPEILDDVFENADVEYKIANRQIAISASNPDRSSQKHAVSGKVTDSSAEPLPGVTVLVKGTTQGTITDFDGNYSISDVPTDATLVFSFVGMKAQEITVGNQTSINITMSADAIGLEEVVAVGYGSFSKSDLTGSVTSVNSEDFFVGNTASPEQLIQGKVAGVQISQASGEPGAGVNIRIRGVNSIGAGSQPLYVVDGIPIDAGSTAASSVGVGSEIGGLGSQNPLAFLSTSDIESINVLKDASATAIYGSRAANGVVVITTKGGKKGRSSVTYNPYVSIDWIGRKMNMFSPEEYVAIREKEGVATITEGNPINWQDEVYRTAITQNHDISFTGTTSGMTYRASINYMDQSGVVQNSDMERFTARVNASGKYFDDRLTLESQITNSRILDSRPLVSTTAGGSGAGDLIAATLYNSPYSNPVLADGSYNQISKAYLNPLAVLDYYSDKQELQRFLGSFSASLDLLDWVSFKSSVGIDYFSTERQVSFQNDFVLTDLGKASSANTSGFNKTWENYFTFTPALGAMNKLNVVAGYSYQSFSKKWFNATGEGFDVNMSDYNNNLGLALSPTISSNAGFNELQSFFGRVNYTYNNRYLLTASLRADGSSKFGENNKYGYFPSVAAAWRMSEEGFMEDVKSVVDNLKLRASYGITGNQDFPSYASQKTYSVFKTADGYTGYKLARVANPDLKWEQTAQYNVGVDFSLFGQALSGSVDYFYKNTYDFLISVAAPPPAASSSQWVNMDGDIINKGFEFVLNSVPVRRENFVFNVDFNFSTLENEVKNMAEDYKAIVGGISGPGLTGSSVQVIENGHAFRTFYLKEFQGFEENGDIILSEDKQYLGSSIPKYIGGLNLSVELAKRWNVSLFMEGMFGHKVFNNTAAAMFYKANLMSSGIGRNISKDYYDENEGLGGDPGSNSSRYLEDGDFLRFSNLNVSYNFDIKSKSIHGIRAYAALNNFAVLTKYKGYDPDISSDLGIDYTSYPKPMSVLLGVSVEF